MTQRHYKLGYSQKAEGQGHESELQENMSWNTYFVSNTVQTRINSQNPTTPQVRYGDGFNLYNEETEAEMAKPVLSAPCPASLTTVYGPH